jgi:hypothetical protein
VDGKPANGVNYFKIAWASDATDTLRDHHG